MRGDQMLFTYLHLAASQECTGALMAAGTTSVADETVQLPDGALPLLFPMSEVAGRLAPMVCAQCLARVEGGRGVVIGGVSGVAPARVVIIGAGVSGMNAVAVAAGTWADIVLFDSSRQPVAAGWCQHCLGRPHAWPDRGGPWHRMNPPRGGPGASLTGIGRRATPGAGGGGRGRSVRQGRTQGATLFPAAPSDPPDAKTQPMPRTLVEIDRRSSEPLYRQVRRALEHGIAAGRFDLRRRLPSSRELAAELSVSRNTISLAYQELIAEGLVIGHERRGLFVNPQMRAAYEAQGHTVVPQIEWPGRMAAYGDEHLPHVEKRGDWHAYRYPFVAGQVDVRGFPSRAWLRSLREALYHPHVFASLQDSVGSDDPLLVEMIHQQLLPARGIEAGPEEILVTVGSQQGLDLLSRVLLGPGRVVAVEDPGYLDARHIFLRAGAGVSGLPVDDRGVCPPARLEGFDLMYITPSHHHPTNVTLSMDRRVSLLQLAARAGTVLVEDDYDSEFRYHGSPSPALKALDTTGDVVYLGTFSKFLSPGLRLGYLVGPRELVAELRNVRRYVLRHPSGHLQRALALLIDTGDYHRSLRRQRARLKEKWERLTVAVQRELPWEQAPYPPGGVSLWMSGPRGLDSNELTRRAEQSGVLIERGDIYFHAAPPPRHHFRLGYAAIPLGSIDEGVALLGQHCRALLDECGAPPAQSADS